MADHKFHNPGTKVREKRVYSNQTEVRQPLDVVVKSRKTGKQRADGASGVMNAYNFLTELNMKIPIEHTTGGVGQRVARKALKIKQSRKK